jgi:hypothetical protein
MITGPVRAGDRESWTLRTIFGPPRRVPRVALGRPPWGFERIVCDGGAALAAFGAVAVPTLWSEVLGGDVVMAEVPVSAGEGCVARDAGGGLASVDAGLDGGSELVMGGGVAALPAGASGVFAFGAVFGAQAPPIGDDGWAAGVGAAVSGHGRGTLVGVVVSVLVRA